MPTLAENKDLFDSSYDWSGGGDEWSQWWGTAEAQWAGALFPRIFPFLRGRILEIAPGHGRWTQFLRDHCTSLIGVDLAPSCVNECRRKFKSDPQLQFEVGDGRKLPMVANASIDFAFSFDSLVHAEADVLESYVVELARVLKPNAVAFLHHSNLAELSVSTDAPVVNSGWRAHSMGATVMRGFVDRAGMSCAQQELIPWGSNSFFMDCISTIINSPNQPCAIVENRRFMEEAAAIRRVSELARLAEISAERPFNEQVNSPVESTVSLRCPAQPIEVSMNNLGKWDKWYANLQGSLPSSFRFADTATYRLGAKFLEDCAVVEDWGVGAGGFKRHRPDAIGIDGSQTPFADKIVDLVSYRSNVDGIFMRHVLEHNYDWPRILRNALHSARKVCIVLFVPFSKGETIKLADNAPHGVDVPDLSLSETEFNAVLTNARIKEAKSSVYKNNSGYGQETIVYIVTETG